MLQYVLEYTVSPDCNTSSLPLATGVC